MRRRGHRSWLPPNGPQRVSLFCLVENAPARRQNRAIDHLAGRGSEEIGTIIAALIAVGAWSVLHGFWRHLRRLRRRRNDTGAEKGSAASRGNKQEIATRHAPVRRRLLLRHHTLHCAVFQERMFPLSRLRFTLSRNSDAVNLMEFSRLQN